MENQRKIYVVFIDVKKVFDKLEGDETDEDLFLIEKARLKIVEKLVKSLV